MLGSLVRKMEPNIGKAFFAACLKNSLLDFKSLFSMDNVYAYSVLFIQHIIIIGSNNSKSL